MYKLFIPFLPIILLITLHSIQAQVDKEFWFVAPEVSANHEDKPIILRFITLDQPAAVSISQPANPAFTPILLNIGANTADSVDLTPYLNSIENKPANTVLNFGLYIHSSSPINALYEVAAINNSEIFVLKGRNALGTKFYTPFQTDYENGYAPWYGQTTFSGIDIVATEDNTLITITPTRDALDHPAGIPFTIVLNRGQTYGLQASGTLGSDHMTGTLIVSDKSIAVTLKDDSIKNTFCIAQGNFDLVGEQMIPVSSLEDEYIILKGHLKNNEKVYIVATQDTTSIFVNGDRIPTATINAGEAYSLEISTPCVHIVTSGKGGIYAPSYLLQLSGFDCELTTSMTPPVICTGSKEVGLLRTTPNNFYLRLAVIAGNESFFTLNNEKDIIQASQFAPVPGTNGEWKWASINLTQYIAEGKGYLLKNDSIEFQAGVLMGDTNKGARSGYLTSFNDISLDLGGPYTVCPGGSKILDAGPGFWEYGWSTQETSRSIEVYEPGIYSVSVINKGSCILEDSIIIQCDITENISALQKYPMPLFSPNPVEKGSMITMNNERIHMHLSTTVEVYNANGLLVAQTTIPPIAKDDNFQFKIEGHLTNGIYFIKIYNEEFHEIEKIIID